MKNLILVITTILSTSLTAQNGKTSETIKKYNDQQIVSFYDSCFSLPFIEAVELFDRDWNWFPPVQPSLASDALDYFSKYNWGFAHLQQWPSVPNPNKYEVFLCIDNGRTQTDVDWSSMVEIINEYLVTETDDDYLESTFYHNDEDYSKFVIAKTKVNDVLISLYARNARVE